MTDDGRLYVSLARRRVPAHYLGWIELLTAVSHREDNNAIGLHPVDEPVRRMRQLSQLESCKLGDHPAGCRIGDQLLRAGKDAPHPPIRRGRAIAGNLERDGLDALDGQRRPDNADAPSRGHGNYAGRRGSLVAPRNVARTWASALLCATPCPAAIWRSARCTSSASSARSTRAS